MTAILLLTAVKETPEVAALSATGIFFLLPLIQVISTPLAFDIWFTDLWQKPLNSTLYVAFSILFGAFIPLYLFTRNKCFDCKPENARTGFAGSVAGFMVGVCPACFSFIGVLLPLGPMLFLTTYSPIFTGVSIAIVLFSIYKLGGFRKTELMMKR
jgi:VIT1/CCC1 family predicted Fe2+/Mn2+ transporter